MTTAFAPRQAAWFATVLIAMTALLGSDCLAQARRGNTATVARTTTENVPNPLQGFSQNRDQPIHIEAATLEVRDKDQMATFSGNVHVVQGDTDLRCETLIVHYEQPGGDKKNDNKTKIVASKSGAKPLPQQPMEAQRIRLLEVKGNVIVTQKEQTATGDSGRFDMRSNIITLVGNVVVSQGQNVLTGDRLVVDMTSGVSKMISNSGTVRGLFQPSRQDNPQNGGRSIGPTLN